MVDFIGNRLVIAKMQKKSAFSAGWLVYYVPGKNYFLLYFLVSTKKSYVGRKRKFAGCEQQYIFYRQPGTVTRFYKGFTASSPKIPAKINTCDG